MAPLITPVAAIVAGKINIKLRVRVVHVWTVSEFNNPNEDNSIHMLLLDDKLGKIQASAKKHLVPKIRSNVEEGSAYDIENVLVTKNDPKYQVTQHRFKLTLIDRTRFFKIDASTIPLNHFDFMPFNEILEAEREEKTVDVIGQVIERDELKEKDVNGRRIKLLDLTLQDSESRRVHCTLWADYAERMNSFLAAHDPSSPVVVLIQQGKLKKYQGVMGVSNAFFGTKLLLDGDLPEAIEFKSKIDGGDVQVSQCISQNTASTVVSLVDDMLQTKRMTIEDLIEATEQCQGIVLATICEIESEYSWYYQACTKCAGRVRTVAGRLYCGKCNTGRNTVPRFKLHVQVMDNTGSTSFILFDRNVSQYVNRTVQDMIDAQPNNSSDYPSDLDSFIGKLMLFKVEVSDGNLLHNWRNYAVKRTTADKDVINQFAVFHNIELPDNEDVTVETALNADENLENVCVGSSNTVINLMDAIDGVANNNGKEKEVDTTPCSKVSGKSSAGTVVLDLTESADDGDVSATKPVKLKSVVSGKRSGKRSAGTSLLDSTPSADAGDVSAAKPVKLKSVKIEPKK